MSGVETRAGLSDEVAVVTDLHEDTLSDDQIKACSGRLLKDVMPLFVRWLNAELERDTDIAVLFSSLVSGVGSMTGTFIMNFSQDDRFAEAMKFAGEQIAEGCAEAGQHHQNGGAP